MWIRSQDKKELVNITRVKISSIYGSKIKKARIYGYVSNAAFLDYMVVLGEYASIEEAITEVDNIQAAILENSNSIYQMKSS